MIGKYNKVFGIDHGNGFFKLFTIDGRGKKNATFPSVLANIKDFVDAESGKVDSKIQTYESSLYPGEEYTFGDHAPNGSSQMSTNASKDRYSKKHYQLLSQFALAKFADDGDTILVVTGTPSSERLVHGVEEEIKKAYEGKHEVKVDGKTKKFTVKCLVKGQPVGTFMSVFLTNEGMKTGKLKNDDYVGIIDIGSGTTDLAGFQGTTSKQEDTHSIQKGVNDIYNGIATHIQTEIGGAKVNNTRIGTFVKKAIETGNWEFTRGRDAINIEKTFQEQLKPVGDSIISQIGSYWKNQENFTHIFITGGGAKLLSEYLKQNWDEKVEVLEDSFYANAIGFYRFGVMSAVNNKV